MTFQSHVLSAALVVSSLATLAVGCADEPTENPKTSMPDSALIAEALFENGGSRRYYEMDGILVQIEQGPIDSLRPAGPGEEGMDEAELYTRLTGHAAPARLVAAAAAYAHVKPSHPLAPIGDGLSDPIEAGNKGLPADDFSRPGPREEFLRLFCTQTEDHFFWRLGYAKESQHGFDDWGTNYYRFGINAIQARAGFVASITGPLVKDKHIELEIPQGWYAGATFKIGGAGASTTTDVVPRGDGALFDHCVNYHY